MSFREELLYDFAVHVPRIMVIDGFAVIDNVKSIEMISEGQIVVKSGARYTAVSGKELSIKEIADERMLIEGEIEEIQFYGMAGKA